MKTIEILLSEPLFQALGWSLLHFIWQGALVALLLVAANFVLRKSTANKRYVVSCAALLLMAALPVATFFLIANDLQPRRQTIENAVRAEIATIQNGRTKLIVSLHNHTNTTSTNKESAASVFNLETLKTYLAVCMPYLVSIWLFGVFILSVRAIGGWILVQRLKRKYNKEASTEWQETLVELAKRLRVSRPVRLCESALAEVPTAIGWLRPVILVPVGALTGLSAQQIEALLAHELAHIRRYDYLVNIFQTVIETFLFYHPAVWWVSRQIRTEREHCCDDLAVAMCGNVLTYARALTDLEGLRHNMKEQFAMASDGGSLTHRVKRLLGLPTQPQRSTAWLVSLLLISVLTFVSLGASRFVVKAGTETKNFIAKKVFGETSSNATNPTPALNRAKAEGGSILGRVQRFLAPPPQPPQSPEPPQSPNPAPQTSEPSPETVAATPMPNPNPNPAPTPPQPSPNKTGEDGEDSSDFIDELKAAGYTNLKADDVIAMKIHGITGTFIRELREARFTDLSVNSLVAFGTHGITAEYIREMKKAFGNLDANDLVAMRIHGVTPEYANQMSSLVGEKLNVDRLVAFRIHGVTPELIREFSSLGFGKLDADDYIAVKVHGLTPKFAEEMNGLGFGKLSLDKLLAMKIHGITPAFVKKVKDKGFTDLTLDQVIQLKNIGVIRDK